MKITVKRSWLPWGMPSIKVEMGKKIDPLFISGCWKKEIVSEWKNKKGLRIAKQQIKRKQKEFKNLTPNII